MTEGIGKDRPDISITGSYGTTVGDFAKVNNYFLTAKRRAKRREPVIVGRVPQPIAPFIARRELFAADTPPAPDGQRLVLVGDGGVGKTELAAAHFRHRVADGAGFGLWVTATSRQAVLSAYQQAARELELEAASAEEAADSLLGWLLGAGKPWIVVLDDVANPADLDQLWPQGQAGQVLVTTRRNEAAWRNIAASADIYVFTPGESIRYLEAKLKPVTDVPGILDEAAELAADLGYLPLALSHASAFIEDAHITCAEYRGLLSDRLSPLADVMPESPAAAGSGYPTAVPAAWSLALDRADALKPRGLARPLWLVISCLNASDVPETVLLAESTRRYLAGFAGGPKGEAGKPVSNHNAKDALRALSRLSLTRYPKAGTLHSPAKSVRTHPLAQRATRDSCAPADLADAARTAATALAETWPRDEADATVIQLAVSNTDAVRAACPEAVWEPDAHAILFHRGYLTGKSGSAAGTAAYFAQLAEESAVRLGADHPDTLLARQEHAHWLGESGRYTEAADCYERLLRGSGHGAETSLPDELELRYWQAHYTGKAGNHTDAIWQFGAIITELVELEEEKETASELLFHSRLDHAHWIAVSGETDVALRLLTGMLGDVRRIQGPDAVDALSVRGAVAETKGMAGDTVQALREWEGLVPVYRRTLGELHPETLGARNRLAWWRSRALGLPAVADELGQLVSDAAKVKGSEDRGVLELRAGLAKAVGRARDPQEAIPHLEEVIRERARRGEADDRETFRERVNLAGWRGRAGRPDLAIADYEQVLKDQCRVLGDDDYDTLFTRYQLIYWRMADSGGEGQHRAALTDLLRDAQRAGKDAAHLVLHIRAQLLVGPAGEGGDIEADLAALIAEASEAFGDDDELTLRLRANLLILRMADARPGAAAQLRSLLPVAVATFGEAHLVTQVIRDALREKLPAV